MKTASKIIVALSICAAGLCARPATVDKIVAVVGNQVITSNELDQAYQNDPAAQPPGGAAKITKKEYLDHMIEKMLIEQEVKRQGVSVTAQEIEQAVNKKRDQMGMTPAEFSQALRDQGITIEAYRDQVRQSLSMAKVVSKEVKASSEISDQEISSYYEKHKDQFQAGDKSHLFHIVVREGEDSAKTIKAIQQQFKKGTTFQQLAEKYSEGEEAKKGGDLGWVEMNQLKPEVRKMIENLKLGEMSDVYKDDTGSHLFFVQGREKGSEISLDQAKEQIRQNLYEKQFQDQYQVWLERLKAKSYIDIRL